MNVMTVTAMSINDASRETAASLKSAQAAESVWLEILARRPRPPDERT
jgi:hypothetical protein